MQAKLINILDFNKFEPNVGLLIAKKVWAARRLKNATIFPSFPFLADRPPFATSISPPSGGEKKEMVPVLLGNAAFLKLFCGGNLKTKFFTKKILKYMYVEEL